MNEHESNGECSEMRIEKSGCRMVNWHEPAFSDLLLTELLSTLALLLSFSELSAFLSSTYGTRTQKNLH